MRRRSSPPFHLEQDFTLDTIMDVSKEENQKRTVAVKPAIVYNMDTQPDAQYNVNNAAIEVMAGVTYHFKNSKERNSLCIAKNNVSPHSSVSSYWCYSILLL